MLGSDDLQPVTRLLKLPAKLKKEEFSASYATFVSALEKGEQNYSDNEAAFESKEDPNTQLISISEARNMGVMPLGASSEKSKQKLQ